MAIKLLPQLNIQIPQPKAQSQNNRQETTSNKKDTEDKQLGPTNVDTSEPSTTKHSESGAYDGIDTSSLKSDGFY